VREVVRVRALVLLAVLVAAFFVFGGSATAGPYTTPAEMMDAEWLQGHNSEITGAMVQNAWRWYGIPPHCFLTIIAAETSMGDPALGGRLVGAHNYGCLKYAGYDSRWGMLASGTITVGGKLWYAFPTPEIGVCALGRYLKIGPSSRPGYYLDCLKRGDWQAFAAVYYGRAVPGYWEYVERLRAIDSRLVRRANECGWAW
jgi:hypothetical protein